MQKWSGLKKELKRAKQKRNISNKEIIFELGCSGTTFYKVVSGERKPGEALVKKLSESLEISEDEINKLITSKDKKETYIITAVIIGAFFGVYLYINNEINTPSKIPIIPLKKEPRIMGDTTSFIKDVTYPDGSYVLVNTNFKKVWRIKNSGAIAWKNRYLMRITPFSDVNCKSDFMIPIKETPVGKEVDIEVYFTSINLVGSCRVDWKMVDKDKRLFFPNKHSLYLEVNVTNNESLIKNRNRLKK